MLRAEATDLPGLMLIRGDEFPDDRGFFIESFNQRQFTEATGVNATFVQDNHSGSKRHVLRGLHYQVGRPQGKLVRALRGEVFDVAADLRRGSPTYGRHWATTLSAENRLQLWIPQGFAHGFLALSDTAEILYKVTDYYYPAGERCVRWDDATLNIDWPIDDTPLLSEKDAQGVNFTDAETFDN